MLISVQKPNVAKFHGPHPKDTRMAGPGISLQYRSCFGQGPWCLLLVVSQHVSNGFYFVKSKVVLGRTPVCQKHHNQLAKRGRNTRRTRQASHVKHLATKSKRGVGTQVRPQKTLRDWRTRQEHPVNCVMYQIKSAAHMYLYIYIAIKIWYFTMIRWDCTGHCMACMAWLTWEEPKYLVSYHRLNGIIQPIYGI